MRSYSGLHARSAEIAHAASPDETAAILDAARRRGRSVTLAGARLSFDSQALGDDIVLSTRGLDAIEIEADGAGGGILRVGPGARWRDMARAAAARGFLVPVIVSSGAVTAGGTVATNGLSRFSPVFGKEGRWIRSLRLVMPDGTRLRASREAYPEVFFAVVSGLGLAGVVTEIEYDLVPAPTNLRVETWVERRPTLEGLGAALRVPPGRDLSAQTAYSVIVLDGDDVKVMINRSRYVADQPLQPMLPHQPQSAVRVPLELAIQNIPDAGRRFWCFAYDRYVREDRPYIDDLDGYTFFMDGNVRAWRFASRVGIPFRAAQQTFVIPSADGDHALLPFIRECRARVREAQLGLAMFDVLHLPEDEPFALSSSRGQAGFAVTLTFDGTVRDRDLPRLDEVMSALSVSTQRAGGRVHLTKNVWARPDVIEAMYGEGLAELQALRRRFDPDGTLVSDFSARLFPSLARPQVSRPAMRRAS